MQINATDITNRRFLHQLYFRFFAAYFVIYIFPFPLFYLPLLDTIAQEYQHILYYLTLWTAKHLFLLSLPAGRQDYGVSDKAYDYVRLFINVVVAGLITITWSTIRKPKKYEEQILYWILTYIRYRFALSMLKYGFEKIQKVQFPFPYSSLQETYGESSPMRLLWNFMGYSTPYNIFIGILEAGAGYLLLFRKTRLLGALLSIVVLSNIVMLNFCYDVPVKLHSVTLLLMAVFLAAPDAGRLRAFFLNKAVPAAGNRLEYNKPWMKLCFSVLTFLIIAYTVYLKAVPTWKRYTVGNETTFQKSPLFGEYDIKEFISNNKIPEKDTNTIRWKTVRIFSPKYVFIETADDSIRSYHLFADTIHKKIQLYRSQDSVGKATLSYKVPDPAHLILQGMIKDDSVFIIMQKQDMNRYELLNRDFHWINEYPYNK